MLYATVAKIYSKNEPSVCEMMKKQKEMCASFAVPPQTAKVVATMQDKCSVKMEKALNLYNRVFGEIERSYAHYFYYSILL